MQQGATPVYPVGHVPLPPPKQRGMPELSSLQTSFIPSQQSWEALIFPPSRSTGAPQMFPRPLHDWPLSQRLVPGSHTTLPCAGAPPQQATVDRHELPVRRHPVAGAQTVAPAPRSTQVREQHPVPPLHGFPSWVQPPPPPPVSNRQKPEPPSLTEHARPQQSAFFPQRSPVAWQEYAGAQKPPLQLVEQQLAPVVQAWPTALQPVPPTIAAHEAVVPPSVPDPVVEQLRVQHSAPVAHEVLTSLHWVAEQLPAVQRLVQHSVEVRQLYPEVLQKLCWVHTPLALQEAEQHSPPAEHNWPTTLQPPSL